MSPAENVTGKRIVAALIDMFILALIFGITTLSFETRTVEHESWTITTYRLNLTGWPFAVYTFVVAAYYIGAEALLAATPGKALLDLRVASVDGRPLNARQAVVRNLLRIVDGLPFLYLAGIIAIAASKRHQRVGDMVAGTVVVRAEPKSNPSETPARMAVDTHDTDPASRVPRQP
jgi:uncharacterized RDD family membrane protein YckC